MTAATKIEKPKPVGLQLLRAPFLAHKISKLPKPTKKQTEEVRADFKKGIRCTVCGTWHHPQVVHVDYVGHAALTDRLLDCDPEWNWEPVAVNDHGVPTFDQNGGMWIKLTVCGVTRLGYGHPDGKTGGDAIKELIGDALRNAAMRFGAALDLWHKGELHLDEEAPPSPRADDSPPEPVAPARDPVKVANGLVSVIEKAESAEALIAMNADGQKFAAAWQWLEDAGHDAEAAKVSTAFNTRKAALIANPPVTQDEIPY